MLTVLPRSCPTRRSELHTISTARHPNNQDLMQMHSRDHLSAPEDSVDSRTLEEPSVVRVEEEEMPVISLNSFSALSRAEEQVQGKGREHRSGERISNRPSISRSWNRAQASRRRSPLRLSWNARRVRDPVSSRAHQGTHARPAGVLANRRSRCRA